MSNSTPVQINDGFEPARRTLRDAKSSAEVRACACEVLEVSTDWRDIRLVSDNRNVLWADKGSEIVPDSRSEAIQRFQEYLDKQPIIDRRAQRFDAVTDEWLDDIYGAACALLLIGLGVVTAIATMIGLAAYVWLL